MSVEAKDISHLLKQIELQNKQIKDAEKTISLLTASSPSLEEKKKTIQEERRREEEVDELHLEVETLEDRLALSNQVLTFFFREYVRVKNILDKNSCRDPMHALIRAAEDGSIHIVRLLLEASVDVNVRDETGGTALIAASYRGHHDVVLELLEFKADPNLKDDGGKTALMFAGDRGDMETCHALVKFGADVDAVDKDGNNVLIMAAFIGHIDVCTFLVEKGANANRANDSGYTALIMSCYPPEEETRYLNAKTDICTLLVGAGCNVNAQNDSGNTALHIACKYGHSEECEILLNAGADRYIRNGSSKLPVDLTTEPKIRTLLQNNNKKQSDNLNKNQSMETNNGTEKTLARRSSVSIIKNFIRIGNKKKSEEDHDEVSEMHNLYGRNDSSVRRNIEGSTSKRQRYAFVHENALKKPHEKDTSSEKQRNAQKMNASLNNQMSVGEKNAIRFSNMANRNSFGDNSSSQLRDSISETRERRRRQSSGASGEMGRKLEELRRKSATARSD